MKASVIIPAYNSCERLYYNLVSLNYQNYPKNDFEVIVVDDCSDDNTFKMASNFNAKYKLTTLKLEEHRGRSYTRNVGILKAEGEIIIFHDSDMIAAKDYIENHIIEHKNSNTVVCGANWKRIYSYYYKNFNGFVKKNFDNKKSKLSPKFSYIDKQPLITVNQIIDGSFINYSFELTFRETPLSNIVKQYGENLDGYNFPWRFFITDNCSVYKQNLIDAEMFDEKIVTWGCEDLDLGYRLYRQGCKFIRRNKILSFHQEHPIDINKNSDNNINYFIEKYQSIDIMLFYYCKYTSINNNNINQIISEINKINKINNYSNLIDLFLEMLKSINYRYWNSRPLLPRDNNPQIPNSLNMEQIKKQGEELYVKYGLTYFREALFILMKDLYSITV